MRVFRSLVGALSCAPGAHAIATASSAQNALFDAPAAPAPAGAGDFNLRALNFLIQNRFLRYRKLLATSQLPDFGEPLDETAREALDDLLQVALDLNAQRFREVSLQYGRLVRAETAGAEHADAGGSATLLRRRRRRCDQQFAGPLHVVENAEDLHSTTKSVSYAKLAHQSLLFENGPRVYRAFRLSSFQLPLRPLAELPACFSAAALGNLTLFCAPDAVASHRWVNALHAKLLCLKFGVEGTLPTLPAAAAPPPGGTPETAKTGAPETAKTGASETAKTGALENAKTSAPENAKTGAPADAHKKEAENVENAVLQEAATAPPSRESTFDVTAHLYIYKDAQGFAKSSPTLEQALEAIKLRLAQNIAMSEPK